MAKQNRNTAEASEREAIRTLHQLRDSGVEPTEDMAMAEEESDTNEESLHEKTTTSAEAKDKKAAAAERKAKRKRVMATIESVFTGDILLAKEATRVYNFMILLGVIFLASIFTMFRAFQKELEYSKLQEEVTLLKEERTQTLSTRIKNSSHSAICNKLKEHNIELEDPTSTPIILE
jgi:hypothetical protein